jgi:hypothetical protein
MLNLTPELAISTDSVYDVFGAAYFKTVNRF